MINTEIYKDVIGYEGLYQVSDMGSVYSTRSDKVLRPGVNHNGYHYVTFSNNGVEKGYRVHRLVAIAFLENPENKEQVNHIDGNKTNNCLSNLEWCTNRENQIHSREVLGNNYKGVIQYDKEWNEMARFTSVKGAGLATGVNRGHITQTCKCKAKSAGGFRWKYS